MILFQRFILFVLLFTFIGCAGETPIVSTPPSKAGQRDAGVATPPPAVELPK
jgi:hypothetical protein